MSTLRQFSEKERDYHAYQARQNYLREQLTRQYEFDEERKAKLEALQREQVAKEREKVALAEKQTAIAEKQAALEEIERLKSLLAKNHLDS